MSEIGSNSEVRSAAQVDQEELDYLTLKPHDERWALCLSGGGIRSATFSLGVLQGLAAHGLLGRFHYLSTVSGGGYIGSWLSSWIARQDLKTVLGALAGASKSASAEPVEITRLRAYSNYLSPVWGVSTDFFTLVSTFLRNLLINWMVLIPLLAATVLFPRVYLGIIAWGETLPDLAIAGVAAAALLLLLWGISYIVKDLTYFPVPGSTELPATTFGNAAASWPVDTQSWRPTRSAAPSTQTVSPRPASDGARQARAATNDPFALNCFLPIAAAAVVLSWVCLRGEARAWPWWTFPLAGALVHLAGCALGLWRLGRPGAETGLRAKILDALFVAGSGAAGGGLVFWLALQSPQLHLAQYGTLAVPALLSCFWFATTLYVAVARGRTSEMDREWWSRSGAWWLRAALGWVLGFALVIYGPDWFRLIPGVDTLGSKSLVAGGGLIGIVTGLIGYWSHGGAQLKERAQSLAAAIGIRLLDLVAIAFIVLLLIGLSYVVSSAVAWTHDCVASGTCFSQARSAMRVDVAPAAPQGQADVLSDRAAQAAFVPTVRSRTASNNAHAAPHLEIALPLFLILIAGGGIMSLAAGVNTFSLHSMYGNRLVRAYLGATNRNRRPHWFTGFDPSDNLSMTQLKQEPLPNRQRQTDASPAEQKASGSQEADEHDNTKLLHVINLALNLVKPSGGRLEWQQRKAASFTVSPLHAGSDELGYAPSAAYAGESGITLARAMTISGAAASPNMGYHSAAPVAFVMTLFNARLGWWLPNPGPAGAEVRQRTEPLSNLQPLLTEALAQTTGESAYVYLSDGGHFDNLGLYEMVKRGCRRIVVVDASCDWKFEFGDLEEAVRKIRIDLGVSIVFPHGLPTPERVRQTRRHYALGIVRYSNGPLDSPENGKICYIKPVLSGAEDLDVIRYAAQHAGKVSPFPHQSTSDQFFNEAQFESYRRLGRQSVEEGFEEHGAWPSEVLETRERVVPEARADALAAAVGQPSPDALKSGAGKVLDSFNPATLIASALTVGGVLGVTGTVALKDATVKLEPGVVALREEDRELLRSLSLNMVPAGELVQVNVAVQAVAEAVAQLSAVIQHVPPRPAPTDAPPAYSLKIETAIAALSQQVRNLALTLTNVNLQTGPAANRMEVYSKGGAAGSNAVDLNDLNQTLRAIHDALRVEGKNSEEARNAARMLAEIIAQLRALNATVAQTLPNRNVRGVGEGASR